MGQAPEKQVQNEWEEYKNNLNSVTTDGHSYYIVQGGDTLYSLCKRFGTDEQTLRSLNDLSDGLKAGAIIKVPSSSSQTLTQNGDSGVQSTEKIAQDSLTSAFFEPYTSRPVDNPSYHGAEILHQ